MGALAFLLKAVQRWADRARSGDSVIWRHGGRTRLSLASRRIGARYAWRRGQLEPLEDRCLLAVFTVDTTADDDNTSATSLREAIVLANTSTGPDTIEFNIPGAGPHTIRPQTQLPWITDSVVLDATTQPGYAGTPQIELDGSTATQEFPALLINSGGNTIRGFAVNGFQNPNGATLYVTGPGGNFIERNFIGTDTLGAVAVGNTGVGVFLSDSPDNVIGGTSSAQRNVIAGNQYGVYISGTSAEGNRIVGNFIGTDDSGDAAIGGQEVGVFVASASNNFIGGAEAGERNVISGHANAGVYLGGAGNNFVRGNYIGTNATGTTAIGNAVGITILGSSANTIGGGNAGEGNLISGNDFHGVWVTRRSEGSEPSEQNVLQGNWIGLDATGAAGLANVQIGVLIDDSPHNTIGGSATGAGNRIAFNGSCGVTISGTNTADNEVIGNRIDENDGPGVAVLAEATRSTVSRNTFANNAGLAIDLSGDGVTLNDPSDSDVGPNDLVNFPELFWQTGADPGFRRIKATAGAGQTVELYRAAPDPTGYGEGAELLGSQAADSSGEATFDVDETVEYVTATATDDAGNTSEFSANLALSNALAFDFATSSLAEDTVITATIIRSEVDDQPLEVTLTSDDETEITVPVSVSIPAGQMSVEFDVTVREDYDADGHMPVTLTATAPGYADGTILLTVRDNYTIDMVGTIDSSIDVDQYLVSLTHGQTFTIPGLNGDYTWAHTAALEILDPLGRTLIASPDGRAVSIVAAADGVYTVRASANSSFGTFTGDYAFSTTQADYAGVTESESNDDRTSADQIEWYDRVRGDLSGVGDVDFFEFYVWSGDTVTFKWGNLPEANPSLRLYDPDGDLLATDQTGLGLTGEISETGWHSLAIGTDHQDGTVAGSYVGMLIPADEPTLEVEAADPFTGAADWNEGIFAIPGTYFSQSPGGTPGVLGSYVDSSLRSYAGQDDWRSSQAVVGSRFDSAIAFRPNEWGQRSQVGLTAGDDGDWRDFSVQWDGYLTVPADGTRLHLRSSGGARLWVDADDNGLFDNGLPEFTQHNWGTGSRQTTAALTLDAGTYQIRLQYEIGTDPDLDPEVYLLWDDAWNSAGSVPRPSWLEAAGTLSSLDDVDVFAVELSPFDLHALSIVADNDALPRQGRLLTIHNRYGQPLWWNAEGGTPWYLQVPAPLSGRYYISIRATDAVGLGTYVLQFLTSADSFRNQRDVPLIFHDYTSQTTHLDGFPLADNFGRPDLIPLLSGFFEAHYDVYDVDVTLTLPTGPNEYVGIGIGDLDQTVGALGLGGGNSGERRPVGDAWFDASGAGWSELSDVQQHVIPHELGHAVGLPHARNHAAFMSYDELSDVSPTGTYVPFYSGQIDIPQRRVLNERDYLDWVLQAGRMVMEAEPNNDRPGALHLDSYFDETDADADPRNDRVVVVGEISDPVDADVYRFTAAAGESFMFDVDAAELLSPLDASLTLYDAAGNSLASNRDGLDRNSGLFSFDPLLMHEFSLAGSYFVEVAANRRTSGTYRLKITPERAWDDDGPRVLASRPDGGELADGIRQLIFYFDDQIDPATLTPENIVVVGDATGTRPGTATFDPLDATLVWTADDPLTADNYTVTVRSGAGGVTDLLGNQLDGETGGVLSWPDVSGNGLPGGDFVTTFAVGGSTPGAAAVTGATVGDDYYNRSHVTLTFSGAIDVVDLYRADLIFRGTGADASFDTSDDTFLPADVLIDRVSSQDFARVDVLTRGYPDPGTYRLEGSLTDANGNLVTIDEVVSFATAAAQHGPIVTDLNVQPGVVAATRPDTVDVTFSGSVDPATLTPANFTVRYSANPTFFDGEDLFLADGDGTVEWDPFLLRAIFRPAAELANGHYLVELNGDAGGIADPDGRLLDGEYVASYIPGSTLESFWQDTPSGDGRAGGDYLAYFSVLAPTAIAGGPYSGDEGSQIPVDGTASTVGGSAIVLYEWDLDNDGVFETPGATANFYSTVDGSFIIGLRVTDADGASDIDTVTITVDNVPPTAEAGGPYSVDEGSSITLDGSTSSDPGEDIALYEWDLDGDGQYDDATGATVPFGRTTDGLYTVELQVTDDDGWSHSDTATVTVRNVAPTAIVGGPYSVDEGSQITLDASASSDPGGDIVLFEWDLDGDGQYDDATGSTYVFSTTVDGDYPVAVRVTDDDSAAQTAVTTVTVRNVAPTASAGEPYIIQEGRALTLDGSGSSDPGNDMVLFEWDLDGDGQYDDASGVQPTVDWAALAALGLATNGTSLPVSVQVSDGQGGVDASATTLTIQNVAPTVLSDSTTVIVSEASPAENTGTFGDAGADPVSLSASVGTVIDNGDGTWSWSYTPLDGPGDGQTVTITANDGDGGITDATFELVVQNVPPTVSADSATVTVGEASPAGSTGLFGDAGADPISLSASVGTVIDNGDGTWSWSYTPLDGPVDSQTVTITANDGDDGITDATFELVVQNVPPTVSADSATVTVSEASPAGNTGIFGDAGADAVSLSASVGTVIDNGDGTWSWSYIPLDGPVDSQTVTITANDGDDGITDATFELVVQNLAPTVSADSATVTVSEASPAGNTGIFGDAGADAVSLSASVGTVIDNGDGTWSWSYTPLDGPVDSQTVTITANDGDDGITDATFELAVQNLAPTVSADSAMVTVIEASPAGNTGIFGDAGADAVSLFASVGTVIDNGDGTWSWSYTPLDGPVDSQIVTITADDGDDGVTDTTFELVVQNVAPTVSADSAKVTVSEASPAGNTGVFGDAGADAVSLSASVGTVIDNGDGTWSWSYTPLDGPVDSQIVTITADDSDDGVTDTTFELVVQNVSPTVSADRATVTVSEASPADNTGVFGDAGADAVSLSASVGTVIDNGDGTWSWSYTPFDGPGDNQTVTITANDGDDGITDARFELVVQNVAPTISADRAKVTVSEASPADNTGVFGDAGADPVALSASVGTVLDNGDGTWNWFYIPLDGPVDSQAVTITANDGDDGITDATFDLVVQNVAPTISVDRATVTVSEASPAGNTGVFGDVDADTVWLSASVGTVIDNGGGTWNWSYTPLDGPGDNQIVTITADDREGGVTDATFNLVVQNVAPTISADNATVTVNEASAAGNTGVFGDAGADTVSLLASVGTVIDNGDGTWNWSYTPLDGPGDSQTVTITANDGDDGITDATFELVVQNVAPEMVTSNIESQLSNRTMTVNAVGVGSDAGEDTLSYEYEWFVNGASIGQTAATLTADYFAGGDVVYCNIRAFDGNDYSPWLASNQMTIALTARVEAMVRKSTTPIDIDANGESAAPAAEVWVDEWTPFYVEIWISTPDGDQLGVASATVDLTYNTDYFAATQIEHNPALAANPTGTIDNVIGRVDNLGGDAGGAGSDLGDDKPVLLARVLFEPRIGDEAGVPLGPDGRRVTSVAMDIQLADADVKLGDNLQARVEMAPDPQTELWPVMYDLDNSGEVGLPDLSFFAGAYGYPVGGGTPGNDWTWISDYDRSGTVDLPDLSFFAPNYQRAVADGQPRRYPDNFPGDWRGQPLRVESAAGSTVAVTPLSAADLAPVFDAAVARLAVAEGDSAAAELDNVTVHVVDLPGSQIGRTLPGARIEIDIDAAGHGWFVDPTTWNDAEFDIPHSDFRIPHSMDLLTAVLHELGHVLGYGHDAEGVMAETLTPGTRRLWGDNETWSDIEFGLDPQDVTPDTIDQMFADWETA